MSDPTSLPTLTNDDLESLARRVDTAFAEVQALDQEAQAKATALKSAIEEFHKVGLTTIVKRLKNDPRGKELLFELVDDPDVYALLAMHGLVRADLRTRVSRVVEMVRPYLQSHGGDVALIDIQDKTVFVRLSGACQGCSMSSVTLRDSVEEALKQHVPEIEHVAVVPTEPTGVIPAEALLSGTPSRENGNHGWVEGPRADQVAEGKPWAFQSGEIPVLLVRMKGVTRAFRNQCAHQGLPLDGGVVDCEAGTLTCPWHGWCYDAANGECITAVQAQLEEFPLRLADGVIWIRP